MNLTLQLLFLRRQIEKQLDYHRAVLCQLPEGDLRLRKNGSYIRWVRRSENTDLTIRRKDKALAQTLASKKYHQEMCDTASFLLRLFDRFLTEAEASSQKVRYAGIVSGVISSCVKGMAAPPLSAEPSSRTSAELQILQASSAQDSFHWLREWCTASYEHNTGYPDDLRYPSKCGLRLRSKSEALITDLLYDAGIPFRYEQKLRVGNKYYFPDFTILLGPGKVIYWEHFGSLLDQGYNSAQQAKLSAYLANGIYPGRDLIITCEDERSPLDISYAEEIVLWLSAKYMSGCFFSPTGDVPLFIS